MPNFTTEELIQYLYKEISNEKREAIDKALKSDWTLKEKMDALQDSKHGLDKLLKSPRPQSVMAILDYAKKTAPVEQP